MPLWRDTEPSRREVEGEERGPGRKKSAGAPGGKGLEGWAGSMVPRKEQGGLEATKGPGGHQAELGFY